MWWFFFFYKLNYVEKEKGKSQGICNYLQESWCVQDGHTEEKDIWREMS